MERLLIMLPLIFAGTFSFGLAARVPALGLMSPAFRDGGAIPVQYARPAVGGRNVSIPLKWSDAPEGTGSFALSIVDIHPVANKWAHWMVVDIPADVSSLPEGASGKDMPTGARELKNSFGTVGYGGPQPPGGTGPHTYVITLYALKIGKLDLRPNATLSEFRDALRGNVLGEATIKGSFER